jgi:chorismate mutase
LSDTLAMLQHELPAGGRIETQLGELPRERALLAERRAWAEELGLPSDLVEEVFRAVVRMSRKVQEA